MTDRARRMFDLKQAILGAKRPPIPAPAPTAPTAMHCPICLEQGRRVRLAHDHANISPCESEVARGVSCKAERIHWTEVAGGGFVTATLPCANAANHVRAA